jgi:hypothetical protein
VKTLLISLLLIPGLAGASSFTSPHLAQGTGPHTVELGGQRFVNYGLVGAGRLSAQTVDFMGDTLGSFSSLAIDRKSWRRVGDHYEATLWTLPDRGRNDPEAGLFYDYAARLHRFRISFTPYAGKPLPMDIRSQSQVRIVPDGGLELHDFRSQPFTGADPGQGSLTEQGIRLPSPTKSIGAGKVSLDSESLQFTRDGGFYIGDEYSANVYYFDAKGRLRGVIVAPAAIVPRRGGKVDFDSLSAPDTGRRNNQGVEGISLSPDGKRLFVVLQSALIQDTASGNANGRVDTRVLVYDVGEHPTPSAPAAHYVLQLPAYNSHGNGKPANKTAAQSEVRALNRHQFLMLARDGDGLGTDNEKPIVYKSVLLVDTDGASNLAGTAYETATESVLRSPDATALKPAIKPASTVELVDMLDPVGLARFGMNLQTRPKNQPLTISEKWEAMDLVPTLDPGHPDDYFLFVGNDNDFIARKCVMQGQSCDSAFDNDNMILVYRLALPTMQPMKP